MPARGMAGDRGKRCQESGVIGFAGGGLRQRQNCEPNLRLLVEMVGFLVSITLFLPQKKRLQTKRSRAFDQSKMDIYIYIPSCWPKKNFQKENLCWNYPSKEGPQETNMEPKKLVVLGRCFGAFSGEPSVSLLKDVLILEGEAQKERIANHL